MDDLATCRAGDTPPEVARDVIGSSNPALAAEVAQPFQGKTCSHNRGDGGARSGARQRDGIEAGSGTSKQTNALSM